ncbi:MAG: hypothetical protein QOK45_729 [Mycobacterium sp.]|jgi:hypothetical protein|nr:hypothetical protein [Mycobacterium sp.]
MLGVALTGVVVVVFDVVAGSATAAIIAGAIAGSAFIVFWLALPLVLRAGLPPQSYTP